MVALAAVLWIGYTVYRGLRPPVEAPKMIQWMPIPVQIGDPKALLGVGVYKWDLPPELNAAMVELVRQQREGEDTKKPCSGSPPCRMLTPVFHPNVDPQKICIGDHWSAG